MLNDRTDLVSLLSTRRSCRPRDMVAPGPSAHELHTILAIAARTPDHGKLNPWRFVHVPRSARAAFARLLDHAFHAANPNARPGELEANEKFAHQAPELVVALFSPRAGAKIPLWEQELSCGAACMNLLTAAAALGYCGGWVTGWAAYSPHVLAGFGAPDEKIAGFIFLGSPGGELEERPRPNHSEIVSEWEGTAP